MKGIILAGGLGTRLYPLTMVTSKQLLPVYDKPMIYYPLSTLMLAGIKDIMIISSPGDKDSFENLLGDGKDIGLNITYRIQEEPNGISQAFVIAEDWINNEPTALILGDNIFYGNGLSNLLKEAAEESDKCSIFGYYVEDPERFGVAEFDENGKVISVEEKPVKPKSNYAITGLYFYTGDVAEKAKSLKPSLRGEYEITDLNKIYLEENKLNVKLLGRGFAWLDTGTIESLKEASDFVAGVEKRQGIQIGCVEEIAYNNSWIDKETLLKRAKLYEKTDYGKFLFNVAEGKIRY